MLGRHATRGRGVWNHASMSPLSIEGALEAYLADRAAQRSGREQRRISNFVGLLKYNGRSDADQSIAETPVGEIEDCLRYVFYGNLFEEEASAHQIREAQRIANGLLRWLVERGHLDADAARQIKDDLTAEAKYVAGKVEARVTVGRLVAVLDDFVAVLHMLSGGRQPDGLGADDVIRAEVLTIRSARNSEMTLEGGGRVVTPVKIPASTARIVRPGWRLLVSAVRLSGTWYLTEVARDPADPTPDPEPRDPYDAW